VAQPALSSAPAAAADSAPAATVETTDATDATDATESTVTDGPGATIDTKTVAVKDVSTADTPSSEPGGATTGKNAGRPRYGRAPDGPGSTVVYHRTPAPGRTRSRPRVAYPAGTLAAATLAGLVAAACVPVDRPGIGWLLAGIAVTGAVTAVHRRSVRTANPQGCTRPVDRERWCWAVAATALLSVGTFRAAGWLFVPVWSPRPSPDRWR
jgi:hypothetical protein